MNSSVTPVRSPSRGRANCRARACCSDKTFIRRSDLGNTSTAARRQPLSPARQPVVSSIFFFGDLRGSLAQLRREGCSFKLLAKNCREVFPESGWQIVSLNAALVQKAGARSKMRRTRDFLSSAYHVG